MKINLDGKTSFMLKRHISFTSNYTVHNKQSKNDSIFTRTLEDDTKVFSLNLDKEDKDL